MKLPQLTPEEIQLFRQRLAILLAVLAVIMAVWLFRLWYLQILEGSYYAQLAQGNRIRVIPQGAPRGIIYDRNNEILAYNRPAFNVQLIPEDTPDLERTLENLSDITEVPVQRLRETVEANRSNLKFKPILLLKDVGRKTADLVDTYQEDVPGVSIAVESKRLYPTAYLTSHVLGYVGVVNESQLKQLPVKQLYSGRIVGQSGIESVKNDALIGVDGGRQVEVDHVGRVLRVISEPVDPVPGSAVHLTVDLRLQRYIRTLLAGKKGAVVVSRPRTGEILAMASYPDYDPNLFVGGVEDDIWTELTTGEDRPLINKTLQGLYPPGSTFKMVLALAGLDSGTIDPDSVFNCPGYYRVGRRTSYCWKRSGHGDMTVRDALGQSCNVFFYKLGMELGVNTIQEYAHRLGFGHTTGLELESEKPGLIPSREWKQENLGEKWYDGETLPVSIGQGFVNVTPIQLLNYINIIANGGYWAQPTVLQRVVNPDGEVVLSEEAMPRDTGLLDIPVEHFNVVREGLVRAVNDRGTAVRARSREFTVAGKTGTAQVVGRSSIEGRKEEELSEELLPHALFVGYAPAEDPQVSLAVVVEHGESGTNAAEVAREILEFYHREIQPLRSRFPDMRQAASERIRTPGDDAGADTNSGGASGDSSAAAGRAGDGRTQDSAPHPYARRLNAAFEGGPGGQGPAGTN